MRSCGDPALQQVIARLAEKQRHADHASEIPRAQNGPSIRVPRVRALFSSALGGGSAERDILSRAASSVPPAPANTLPAASSPTRMRPCGFRTQKQPERSAPMATYLYTEVLLPRNTLMQAAVQAGGGGGISGGKTSVNRALFPYAVAEGGGIGHAPSPALQVQAPSSPSASSGNILWEVGEGCEVRSLLKENLAARYRGQHVPGDAHRRAVSASFSLAESDSWRETVSGGSGVGEGKETPAPSHKRRGSGEWKHFSAGAGLGQGEVDVCQQVGTVCTPSGLRNGVLLQHRFCPWDGAEFRPLSSTCTVCGATRTRSRYSGSNDTVLAQLLKPPWERVLWKKQPYDDNYVDRQDQQHVNNMSDSVCLTKLNSLTWCLTKLKSRTWGRQIISRVAGDKRELLHLRCVANHQGQHRHHAAPRGHRCISRLHIHDELPGA